MPLQGFYFGRPIVVFHSDDWGRVGVRDQEGFDTLRAAGVPLGSDPYDFYTLETADDVQALCGVLLRHRDSVGRSPCLVMNFIVANVDFHRTLHAQFEHLYLCALAEGLPGRWRRPGLLEAYREGIKAGILYPALHGLTHFCRPAVESWLQTNDDRSQLLRTFYGAETPYIHHRMPWVGFEYWNASRDSAPSFLPLEAQKALVKEGVDAFSQLFGFSPASACAPGYRANEDTHRAWAALGIKVAQNGPGIPIWPYVNRWGVLQLHRNVVFEPALDPSRYTVEEVLWQTARCLARGMPAIVCLHAINFHSSLKNYRALTLERLDEFLSALEAKYEDLLYLHDADLYDLVRGGSYTFGDTNATVPVRRRWIPALDFMRYVRNLLGKRIQASE